MNESDGAEPVLDLLKLKTLIAVAESGSFTSAATGLGYSQSSVSGHIQALEREFDAILFDRLAKSALLTEEGSLAVTYARRMLSLAEEAKASVVAMKAGRS